MRRPLPLVDSTRVEFGFERTVCACDQCTGYCRHLPGYLVPVESGEAKTYTLIVRGVSHDQSTGLPAGTLVAGANGRLLADTRLQPFD
jgi:hypothetical protein